MKAKRSTTIKRLASYLLKHRWLFLLAIIMAVLANLLALLAPKLSGEAIDIIATGSGNGHILFDQILLIAFKILICYLFSSVLSYFLSIIMIEISRNVTYAMRQEVFSHLMQLPVAFYDTHQGGDIISHVTYDIDVINATLTSDLVQLISSSVTVVGSLFFMLSIAPILVLVFVITIPLSFLLTKYITTKTRPLFSRRSKKLGELNGLVEEMVTGQKTIRAYHQEKNTIHRVANQNQDTVDAYYQAEYYGRMTGPSVNFVNNISLALISVFGAVLYLADKITLGNISSFVLYSRKFSGPINEMANIYGEFQSAFSAAERVFRLLDEPLEAKDPQGAVVLDKSQVTGDVRLENISFGYTSEHLIIRELDFHAKPGQTVAIVGETGAGKTTIINLLMRFYDVSAGDILIDNQSIYHVTRDSLRNCFSLVLQDTWLFQGTVHDNIAYGKQDATRQEVIEAAKAAKIHHHISQLPKGYDTIISDAGTNLSKGQKQLMIIARAMLMDAPMLILDEATSNVDIYTEQKIQEAMLSLMSGKTSFVIAHRLSTIQNADVILVVKDGILVESGKHEDLLALGGVYKQMHQAQFQ